MKPRPKITSVTTLLLICGALLSVGIWTLYQARVSETTFDWTIVPSKPRHGLMIFNPLPPEIQITVSGPHSVLERLKHRGPDFALDLTALGEGVHTLNLDHKRLNLPPQISLIKTSPQEIIIELGRALIKRVPIKLDLTGDPAPGYLLVDHTINPPAIRLKGPQKALASVSQLLTKPIDISGTDKSLDRQVSLTLPEMITIAEKTSRVVSIHVVIEPQMASKTMADVIVKAIADNEMRATIDPPMLTLTINGPTIQLEKLDSEAIRAEVKLQDLKPGIYVRSANIKLPVGVTLIKAQPEIFTAHVFAEPKTN